jgi:flagellar biosynthesis/type III secretory pathway chaperone
VTRVGLEPTERRAWLGTLVGLLDEQIDAAGRLLAALRDERQALVGPAVEPLAQAGALKESCIAQVEQLEQRRRLTMQAAGLGFEGSAMTRLIADCRDWSDAELAAGVAERWQRMLELTRRCRDANETNGLITQTRQRQVLQLLGLLRGGSAGATYGPDGGSAMAGSSTRAIARA